MDEKKELMINNIMNIEYVPNLDLKTYDVDKTTSFPISHLGALGSSGKPILDIVSRVKTGGGGSGFYYVSTKGKEMFKSGGKYIGSLKDASGAVGGGQARLTPVPVDPASMSAAVATMAIEEKLNDIIEGQKDIMDFLMYQEKAKIKGNINTLLDVLNNYKYNVGNEKYLNNKHILVQAIKNESEKSIILIESLIEKLSNKKLSIHFENKVDEYISDAVDRLNDYQLSLYQLAFSSFLEVMLLENFNENYIDSVMKNINEHKLKYDMYSVKLRDKVKTLSSTSVQNSVIGGVAKASVGLGRFIEKTPLGRTQLDEKLQSGGNKLKDVKRSNVDRKLNIISDSNNDLTLPFERTIEMVKLIYKDDYSLLIDNENIYLDFKTEEK